MEKIIGKYTSAVIYSKTAEDYAKAQIKQICDNEACSQSIIRVMPDVHPGQVGPIGLTMTIGDKILPNLIGVDIGCGISYMKIKKCCIEYQKLDKVIRENIPVGGKVRAKPLPASDTFDFTELRCYKHIDENKACLSLGTLGGGNHFIELDKDTNQDIYVFVHSGSRPLGKEVTEHYLKKGYEDLKHKGMKTPYELTYLEGAIMDDYLHDLLVVQEFASLNRKLILKELEKNMKWKSLEFGECIHNYVDKNNILRKGASSAYIDETVIIPINMRDGVILAKGKGNKDWNCSAPHGAGRILSRSEVKNHHTVSDFKKSMKGIYSSTIGAGTLDEAPFAYRDIDEITEAIKDTVEIKSILKPIYNYKANN